MRPVYSSTGLDLHPPEIRLTIVAVIMHLFLALTIQLVASFALIPKFVDEHGLFTYDSLEYRADAISLAGTFRRGDVLAWFNASSSLHVKLYSLCYVLTAPISRLDVLAVEPLNLSYYLLTLCLIYAIGREVFSRQVGVLAASVVTFWPSFLLHTVQFLKDPLYITCILALTLLLVSCLTRNYSPVAGAVLGVAGGALTLLLWPVRSNMWALTPVLIGVATLLLVLRQLLERHVSVGNILCMVLLITACAGFLGLSVAPRASIYVAQINFPAASLYINEQVPAPEAKPTTTTSSSSVGYWLDYTAIRLNRLRSRFIKAYAGAGSNIDYHVQFNGAGDVIRYLPRAMLIGLFSPFPDMWFSPGKEDGRTGRLIAAFETLLMYLNFPLVLFGLWKARRRWGAWQLIMTSTASVIGLAMIVTNIGALYRMRIVFWMLLVLIGANGILHLRKATGDEAAGCARGKLI